jgi:hypothetical protein
MSYVKIEGTKNNLVTILHQRFVPNVKYVPTPYLIVLQDLPCPVLAFGKT